MTAPKVALVSTDYLPSIGGVAAHVHFLAGALRGLGCEACVVTTGDGRKKGSNKRRFSTWIERDGVPVLELGVPGLPKGIGRKWWEQREMARVMAKLTGDPLIVHWHDHTWAAPLIAPYDRAVRLFTNHTSQFLQALDTGTDLEMWRWQLGLADRIIGPSHELTDTPTRIGYPAEQCSYVPNAVDADVFAPDEARRRAKRSELGIDDDEVLMLVARRIVPKNGVIDLAHSFRLLGDLADRLRILFAGGRDGKPEDYEAEVIGAVRRSPLDAKSSFLGRVPNRSMPDLFRAADFAVLPSLREATSIAGLEAMACGLPLIGTRIGGIPEIIDHGVTGLLVESGSPLELSEAVRQLVEQPALRRSLGAAARQRVLDEFTWQRIAQQTIEVYQQAHEQAKLRWSANAAG